MPYNIYKLIHFLGIFAILAVLAGASLHTLRGGTRADFPSRRVFGIVHGVASFLILLGGFGMLARIGVVHGQLPTWVFLKLAIWLVISGAIALVYRSASLARTVLVLLPFLAVLGAAIALYKPFS